MCQYYQCTILTQNWTQNSLYASLITIMFHLVENIVQGSPYYLKLFISCFSGLLAITLDYDILVFRHGKYIIVYNCILGLSKYKIVTFYFIKIKSMGILKWTNDDIWKTRTCKNISSKRYKEVLKFPSPPHHTHPPPTLIIRF